MKQQHQCSSSSSSSSSSNSSSKGKGLDTCYSATYMSQTRDQQRFTISEVAADWHEPIVPQRIMWPSIAAVYGNSHSIREYIKTVLLLA